jgi:anti-sigma-K factor RskA
MNPPNPEDDGEEIPVQYVLGELRRDEADAFERRLAADPALAAEVRRLRGALGMMAFAKVTEPPPELRARVLRAAAAEARKRRSGAPRRVVWSRFAAAAAAVLALALGLDAYRTRQELALELEIASTLLEPNVVRTFTLAGTGAASRAFGRVSLDLDAKRGAAVLKKLPALPAGQIYRLWAQVGEKAVPCGDFGLDPQGAVLAQFAVPVESYTAPIGKLFVTVEAAGTAGPPSGAPVMESV